MQQSQIYTVGGGYYLYTVFNYLAAFTASTDFKLFMSIAITIGALALGWKMLWGMGLKDILAQIILMMLVGLGGMGIKAKVVIIDETAGTVPIYGIVSNVPWAVAFVGHLTSEVSYLLTERMETMLSPPDNLSYQRSGMLFGATLLSQAARWRAVSPKIHELLVNYTQNCVIDATLLGHMDLEAVANSGALDGYISANIPQSLAYYDPVLAETKTCAERWTAVRGIINTEVNKVMMQHAASSFPGGTATGSANIAKLKGTLSDFQYMIGMSSTSAVATVRQAMLLTAMDDSLERFIASSGNDAAMALYQKARTDVQTKASYSAIGASSLKWVPLLKIALETVYYGAFPLALFMMMSPFGMAVLKGYFGGFVWLASWGPISALLHWIVLESAAGYYRSAGFTTTDGTINDVVLSLSNLYQMQSVEADIGAVAGYLMMSVPFLATAIMFGAGKMTSMATSLLNVGQGAAIETGREAATGSISLGNVSMNNMAANKWNTSSVVDEGRYTGFKGNGASFTRNTDGSTTYGKGSAISDFGFNGSLESSVRQDMSERVESTKTAAATATAEFSSYLSGASARTTGFVNSVMASTGSSETGSVDMSNSQKSDVTEAWGVIEDFAKENNISTNTALTAALAAQAGVDGSTELGTPGKEALGSGLSIGARAGADAKADLSVSAGDQEMVSLAQKAAHDQKVMSALESIDSVRESSGWSAGKSETNSSDMSQRYSLDDGRRMARAALRSISEAETAATGLSYLESNSATASVNINNAAAERLTELGYEPWEVLNSSDPKDLAVIDKVVDSIADGITSQAVKEASVGTENFSLDDPTVVGSITPQGNSKATLGDISIDGDTLREDARGSYTAGRHYTDQRFSELDNTARSNGQRDDYVRKSTEIVEGADTTMAGRLSEKVVRSTAELLGITDNQAEWLLKNDPEFQVNTQDAVIHYRENSDALKAKIETLPFAPDGSAKRSEDNATTERPQAPAPSQGNAFIPVTYRPSEEAETAAPIDLGASPANYDPVARDKMIRSVIASSSGEDMAHLLAGALTIKNGAASDPSPHSAAASVGSDSQLYKAAAYASDLVMSGAVQSLPPAATASQGLAGPSAVQREVWDYFAGKGLEPHQIAAVLGNVSVESGFNPMAVGDNGTSGGLFQFHNERLDGVVNSVGGWHNLGDVQGQLDYAWHELNTSESGTLAKLRRSETVEEATAAFVGFERPQGWTPENPTAAMHFDRRLGAAEDALFHFAGTRKGEI